jgi:hypothetical protein
MIIAASDHNLNRQFCGKTEVILKIMRKGYRKRGQDKNPAPGFQIHYPMKNHLTYCQCYAMAYPP